MECVGFGDVTGSCFHANNHERERRALVGHAIAPHTPCKTTCTYMHDPTTCLTPPGRPRTRRTPGSCHTNSPTYSPVKPHVQKHITTLLRLPPHLAGHVLVGHQVHAVPQAVDQSHVWGRGWNEPFNSRRRARMARGTTAGGRGGVWAPPTLQTPPGNIHTSTEPVGAPVTA